MGEQGKPGESSNEELRAKEATGEIVEGGHVRAFDELSFRVRHREDTARRLAYSLVAILGASFFVHYIATLLLEYSDRTNAVENLARIFNAWLPAIASLVGAAVTYYFTKERER